MVDKTAAEVAALMFEKLKQSGITAKDAKQFKPVPLTASQCRAKYEDFPHHVEGFVIPYFGIDGKQSKFFRYRYLGKTAKGLSALAKKDIRYVQPPGSLNEIYFPPNLQWKKIAEDPKKSIVITEGELKSICGCLHGLPTLGLGGVWCFRSGKRGLALLPQFKQIEWKERQVYLAYDSDSVSNPDVAAAENALARMLTDMGARVFIVRIPPLEDMKKVGLDDYIMDQGVEAFQALMVDSMEWEKCAELHRLNEEVLYVRDPGLIVRMDTMKRISPRAFVDHAYSTRTFTITQTVTSPNGSPTIKVVEKSAAKEWLKWPFRAEVEQVTYAPGKGRVHEGMLNCWRGWGCEPVKGDMKIWHQFLDYMFRGNRKDRKWFEQWAAYPLQHPGVKLYTAVLIWGARHGTGKSFLGYMIKLLYGENGEEIMEEHLRASHNEWAENKQFVMGDELTSGDKRHSADLLKSLITRRSMRMNIKYVPSYSIVDVINYYFTSNHNDAIFMEDTDRRYFVHEAPNEPLPDDFYHRLERWYFQEGGMQALFHYLLHLDLTGFDPRAHAPETDSKIEMKYAAKSEVGAWVADLRADPDGVLRMDRVVVGHDLFTAQELLTFFDPEGRKRVTANGMARELRRADVPRISNGRAVSTDTGWKRLWVIRNAEKWTKVRPQEAAKQYDEERGAGKKRKFQ